MSNFLRFLGVADNDTAALNSISKAFEIPKDRLKYYDEQNVLPTGRDLDKILAHGLKQSALELAMGHLTPNLLVTLQAAQEASTVYIEDSQKEIQPRKCPKPDFETGLGKLFRMDCLEFLKGVPDDSVDLVFADPPFNLDKLYPSLINDSLKSHEYLDWCRSWLYECCRVLKHGGSLFVWNLPKWNLSLASYLNMYVSFRHNISVDIKYSLPIQGRLYPSNYSLLYYVKGEKPNTFTPDRLPMPTCPHCFGDLRDYGGYKAKMNPSGVSLTDVWTDISPVRHRKYKKREGSNELPVRLMDRIIEMASRDGDLVLDPFGGSGTTYVVAELKGRRWMGSEIGPLAHIKDRFASIDQDGDYLKKIRSSLNALFESETKKRREKIGLWTTESIAKPKPQEPLASDDLFFEVGRAVASRIE